MVCPQIVFSGDLADEATPHIRRIGIRFPTQRGGLLKELEEQGKFSPLKSSAIKRLSEEEKKLLRGRGHDDVTDDRPVVEAARSKQACIITQDPHIQGKQALWKKKLGIEVYAMDEVQ